MEHGDPAPWTWGNRHLIDDSSKFSDIRIGPEPATLLSSFLKREQVPPAVIVANDGAQVLAIWAQVSGVDFKYDEASIAAEAERGRVRMEQLAREVAEREAHGPIEDDERGYDRRPILDFSAGGTTREFYGRLAAMVGCYARQVDGVWVIEPAQGQVLEDQLRRLIGRLKEEEFDGGQGEAARTLVRIGNRALPALVSLLEQNRGKDERYFYGTVIYVLMQIDSEERNRAFLAELSHMLEDRERYLSEPCDMLIHTLGRVRYRPAIPALKRAMAASNKGNAQRMARAALIEMGETIPSRPEEELTIMDGETASLLETPELAENYSILLSTIDGGFEPFGLPLEVATAEAGERGATFRGPLRGRDGYWKVVVRPQGSEGALIEANYHCGNVCGAWFEGRAENRDGKWVLVSWKQTAVS